MILESFFRQFTLIHLVLLLGGLNWIILYWPDADGNLYYPRYGARDTPKPNPELTDSSSP